MMKVKILTENTKTYSVSLTDPETGRAGVLSGDQDNIYYNGVAINGGGGTGGYTGPTGASGLVGPTGPTGLLDLVGNPAFWGSYIYYNDTNSKWVIGSNNIILGINAGKSNQGLNDVAIGVNSGNTNQGDFAVAIGNNAGSTTQGQNAIAIGNNAGYTGQGQNTIAIGTLAGYTGQHNNTIILNAKTNEVLNSTSTDSIYIKPIRNDTINPYTNVLSYDSTSGEIIYRNIANSSFGSGNTLTVDALYGDDSLASLTPYNKYSYPFKTINSAIFYSVSGEQIFIRPGTYYEGPLTLKNGIGVRGASVQTVIIGATGVSANTTLMTMGENTRLEDVTLSLTSSGHYNLTGISFPGTTTTTAKLRTAVVSVNNSSAPVSGSSDVYGVLCGGTGSLGANTFSFNCIKGSTINVYSNGQGKKRGILVNNSNIATTRDTNVYVAQPTDTGSTGSYVGIETNDPGSTGSIQLRSTTIGCVKPTIVQAYTASDILQTTPATISNPTYLASSGIQIGPGTDLVTKSAGGKGFSTYVYPTTIFYGLRGAINTITAGSTGYLWPGSQAINSPTFPDSTTPPAFYRIQQPAILSGLFISANTAPGFNGATPNTTTITISRTPEGGTKYDTIFTKNLSGAIKNATFYDGSVDFNTGDQLHVSLTYTSGSGSGNENLTTDLTVQVDMF